MLLRRLFLDRELFGEHRRARSIGRSRHGGARARPCPRAPEARPTSPPRRARSAIPPARRRNARGQPRTGSGPAPRRSRPTARPAFRSRESARLAVALGALVVVVVDRDDPELAIELIGGVAVPGELGLARLAGRPARARDVRAVDRASPQRQSGRLRLRPARLAGMLGTAASSGSCTTAMPPRSFTVQSPAVPSSSAPERITPMTRGPKASAAERKSGSTAGTRPVLAWTTDEAKHSLVAVPAGRAGACRARRRRSSRAPAAGPASPGRPGAAGALEHPGEMAVRVRPQVDDDAHGRRQICRQPGDEAWRWPPRRRRTRR